MADCQSDATEPGCCSTYLPCTHPPPTISIGVVISGVRPPSMFNSFDATLQLLNKMQQERVQRQASAKDFDRSLRQIRAALSRTTNSLTRVPALMIYSQS